jgi:hypothetical protein
MCDECRGELIGDPRCFTCDNMDKEWNCVDKACREFDNACEIRTLRREHRMMKEVLEDISGFDFACRDSYEIWAWADNTLEVINGKY